MWYIEQISMMLDNVRLQDTSCFSYDFQVDKRNAVFLWLRNNETGETVDIIGYRRPPAEFQDVLLSYNPYGCLVEENGDMLFVAIDKPSLKFLDYIEAIEELPPDIDEALESHIKSMALELMPLDEHKTLYGIGGAYKMYSFTLFDVMCFSTGGWYGEEYYLTWRGRSYRVRFNDARKARAWIGKHVSEGYNPVLQYASELRHLRRGATLEWGDD